MRKLEGTEMKTLFILSIVVPVSLLTTFKLTGILQEPPSVERIMLEPVALTLSRPNETTALNNLSVQNAWTKEALSILIGVKIYSYREGPNTPEPYDGHDGLMFQTYVNASFSQEHIDSIKISLHPLDENAVLLVSEERWNLLANNATFTALQYLGANETEAYIKAKVSNSPVSISDSFYWVFLDESESHELQITVEATHINKTSTELVTISLTLKITSSNGK
jgi:hypothetical protein